MEKTLYSLDDKFDLYWATVDPVEKFSIVGRHPYFQVTGSNDDGVQVIPEDWIGVAWFETKKELVDHVQKKLAKIKQDD